MKKSVFAGIILLALAVPVTRAAVVGFEGLSLGSPLTDGSIQYGSTGTHYWNGSNATGNFTTQGATFLNIYNTSFDSWEGFAYSNTTDTTTPGFGNQYSAFPGSGAGGSSHYAIGYQPFSDPWNLTFVADEDFTGRGLEVTNTTYVARDMLTGSGFSKKFGGTSGNDADWFLLSIEGRNNNVSQGTVNFYLADYRFANNSLDYILDEWTFVDLSALGVVDELRFTLTSSDNGMFGMNTPAYFALDNVGAIPEPSVVTLLVWAGGGALLLARRRRAAART
ncbi:MAG: DUF4465 domain-containing protein [Candidatus Methylacidiphilales bacterium]|nr:DUF4465 domain-containing protein [Candidatus Methylacidiphilales bacterium]